MLSVTDFTFQLHMLSVNYFGTEELPFLFESEINLDQLMNTIAIKCDFLFDLE